MLVAIALLCIVQSCFYRARSIEALPDSNYTVVPVVSMALRASAEVVGRSASPRASAGFFVILLSGPFGAQLLGESGLPGIFFRGPSSQSSFVAGLSVLAYTATTSFAPILFFYYIAEMSLAWVDAARRLEQLSPRPAGAATIAVKCARCGASLETDSDFCDQCGASRAMAART